MRKALVYIPSENVYGVAVRQLAYGAIVEYTMDGIFYESILDQEDYIELEQWINE